MELNYFWRCLLICIKRLHLIRNNIGRYNFMVRLFVWMRISFPPSLGRLALIFGISTIRSYLCIHLLLFFKLWDIIWRWYIKRFILSFGFSATVFHFYISFIVAQKPFVCSLQVWFYWGFWNIQIVKRISFFNIFTWVF